MRPDNAMQIGNTVADFEIFLVAFVEKETVAKNDSHSKRTVQRTK